MVRISSFNKEIFPIVKVQLFVENPPVVKITQNSMVLYQIRILFGIKFKHTRTKLGKINKVDEII